MILIDRIGGSLLFRWRLNFIVFSDSKSRGSHLLAGESHICWRSKLNLAFDTCWGIFTLSSSIVK